MKNASIATSVEPRAYSMPPLFRLLPRYHLGGWVLSTAEARAWAADRLLRKGMLSVDFDEAVQEIGRVLGQRGIEVAVVQVQEWMYAQNGPMARRLVSGLMVVCQKEVAPWVGWDMQTRARAQAQSGGAGAERPTSSGRNRMRAPDMEMAVMLRGEHGVAQMEYMTILGEPASV
ncbi:hypothetical protein LshimejAT787_0600610 [Lyophyllum shimeji]|uniref:Uncharacterized protein n=1 Tax=Lyophyllum shimeji TaxID=47721 RepID=A0A9P3PNX4_LYOSH|nr:hypothetical protein LshimejAT787_0600610 [Lyophyllum shimeji]